MNDHDLDALIRDALDGEPPVDRVQRLEQFWQERLAADRRYRRASVVALAASLALLVTGVVWLINREAAPQVHQVAERAVQRNVQHPQEPAGNAALSTDDVSAAAPPAGRPATSYEQAMFRLSVAQATKAEATVVEMNPEAALQRIEERVGLTGLLRAAEATPHPALRRAILRRLLEVNDEAAIRSYLSLVANERTRSEALAAVDELANPPTDALFALLHDERKSVRTSAAMALGRINGPDVTATLIKLVTQDRAAPAEAWIALLACRGESAQQFIADAAHHPRMLGRLNNARLFWQTIQ